MRYPKFIKRGDAIGFVSPAFSCAEEPYTSAFRNALSFWEREGFSVSVGPNTYVQKGVGICNTPKECAKELLSGYISSKSDALISCGGGELMCETISELDFEAIKNAKPKWFMGYSDNTNFTFLLTTLCDTASIYGPCAPSFGMEPLHPSLKDAYDLLTGKKLVMKNYDKWEKESGKDAEHPLAPYNCTEPVRVLCFTPDPKSTSGYSESFSTHFSGRLLGGCMDCLAGLVGTRFDRVSEFAERYREDGIIWYLEACDRNVYDMRRILWSMEEAGWFSHTKGFVFGRPANGGELMGLTEYEAVLPPTCQKLGVPVLTDADIGHQKPMMPLINGAFAQVDFAGGNLTIAMERDLLYDKESVTE